MYIDLLKRETTLTDEVFFYLNLSKISQNYFELIWMSILIKTSCFENHYEGTSFIQVWEKIRNILKTI